MDIHCDCRYRDFLDRDLMIGRKVYGNGPMPARVMLVGEGPGMHESAQGVPFVGASGTDLDYVFLKRAARLRREDIYVTNVVKWRTDEDDRAPNAEELARDEQELITEIDLCSPEIIVAVGKVAAGWFMQSSDVDMEKYVGTPISCPRYPDKLLFCTYHPAAGLHQPERYYHQIYGQFERLGQLVRGEIGVLPPRSDVHYSEIVE